ncbi:MAG: hypothetical protein N2C14_28970, partial [Planctomycetales bacterium]
LVNDNPYASPRFDDSLPGYLDLLPQWVEQVLDAILLVLYVVLASLVITQLAYDPRDPYFWPMLTPQIGVLVLVPPLYWFYLWDS